MAEESNAYDVVLADLIAKREQLDQAIAALQGLKAGGGTSGSVASVNGATPTKIESDTFFGMTIIEAAKKYLAMAKRPQRAGTITDALKAGGYAFSTANPGPVVSSLLSRDDAKNGEIVRVGRGSFGLAAWYKSRPKRGKQNDEEETENPNPPLS